jgi:hypothetical protein
LGHFSNSHGSRKKNLVAVFLDFRSQKKICFAKILRKSFEYNVRSVSAEFWPKIFSFDYKNPKKLRPKNSPLNPRLGLTVGLNAT